MVGLDFKVYNNVEELQQIEESSKGKAYIYILDFGRYVKIGYTENPYRRIKYCDFHSIWKMLYNKNLKKIAISTEPVIKYKKVEAQIHKVFREYQVNGQEVFEITFKECISKINGAFIVYSRNGNIVLDLSETNDSVSSNNEDNLEQDENIENIQGNVTIYISLLKLKLDDMYRQCGIPDKDYEQMKHWIDEIAITIIEAKTFTELVSKFSSDLSKSLGI